jgi:hypothetical protein
MNVCTTFYGNQLTHKLNYAFLVSLAELLASAESLLIND